MDEKGDLYEMDGTMLVKWEIPDFFSSSDKKDICYRSPLFGFSNSCFCLSLYPNGETVRESSGWIGLYFINADPTFSGSVTGTLGIKTVERKWERKSSLEYRFSAKHRSFGVPKFISRSELLQRKSVLAPSDVLTVYCDLTTDVPRSIKVSSFSRLLNLSRDMGKTVKNKIRSDITVKVKGSSEVRLHKAILESRCGYFEGMLAGPLPENSDCQAEIEDIDVFQSCVSYMYTGFASGISQRNVCGIYVAADRLLMPELNMCLNMCQNMCLETVCDALLIGKRYGDEELWEKALRYFCSNSKLVFDSDQWKNFKEGNSALVPEVFESVVNRMEQNN